MVLSPGLTYLLHKFPRLLVDGTCLYFAVRILRTELNLPAPVAIIAVGLISLGLLLLQQYVTASANRRAALRNGAILPPDVNHSSFYNAYAIMTGLRNGYPGDVFARWATTYGNTFKFNLPTSTGVYTHEPHHIKAMLTLQFDSFEKGPILQQQLSSFLGTGIFNADGDMWRFHRGITRPFFNKDRINDFEIFERSSKAALMLAENRLAEGFSVDFQDLVSRFTLDTASEFLFGSNVGSLSAGLPYPPSSTKRDELFENHPSNHFVKAFSAGQAGCITRIGLGADWPLMELWGDKIRPSREVIDAFTQPLLVEAQKKWKITEKDQAIDAEKSTLLEHLITQTEDIAVIKDELVNLLVAGRDTTMCLLSFCVYMLSEHPHLESRLRKEISEKIGFASYSPSHEQLGSLKYMRAFINEVLRLYPPAPMNNRASKEAVVFPSDGPLDRPFYIPANTVCFYSVMNLHRRTDLWGPDALEFDPDRFLDERLGKYLAPNPFIFVPFNAGPRICLGQQLVYREATYFLTRLLQKFTEFSLDKELTLSPPSQWATEGNRKNKEKIYPVSHITMFIKGGLWVKMKRFQGAGPTF